MALTQTIPLLGATELFMATAIVVTPHARSTTRSMSITGRGEWVALVAMIPRGWRCGGVISCQTCSNVLSLCVVGQHVDTYIITKVTMNHIIRQRRLWLAIETMGCDTSPYFKEGTQEDCIVGVLSHTNLQSGHVTPVL